MGLEEIRNEIRTIGQTLSDKSGNIACYLFGSILRNDRTANDIDILILYQDGSQPPLIRNACGLLSKKYPLHFTFLTYSEEKQFNFIAEQQAEEIFRT